jgi:hypothetical protein
VDGFRNEPDPETYPVALNAKLNAHNHYDCIATRVAKERKGPVERISENGGLLAEGGAAGLSPSITTVISIT